MRSRVSTGEEWPRGSVVFHTRLRWGPSSMGRFLVVEMPVPFGPRNCDQSSSAVAVCPRHTSNVKLKNRCGAQVRFGTLPLVDKLRSNYFKTKATGGTQRREAAQSLRC